MDGLQDIMTFVFAFADDWGSSRRSALFVSSGRCWQLHAGRHRDETPQSRRHESYDRTRHDLLGESTCKQFTWRPESTDEKQRPLWNRQLLKPRNLTTLVSIFPPHKPMKIAKSTNTIAASSQLSNSHRWDLCGTQIVLRIPSAWRIQGLFHACNGPLHNNPAKRQRIKTSRCWPIYALLPQYMPQCLVSVECSRVFNPLLNA